MVKSAKMIKFQGMKKKKKMGRPPKAEADKMKRRITVPLTDTDFQDLLDYEKEFGKREHAQTVRDLFLEALRKRLGKLKKPT
jgi:hypothetical protein